MWIKIRTRWAWGSTDHEIMEIPDMPVKEVKEYLDDMYDYSSKFNWSEMYRGYDVEVLDPPPLSVLKDELGACERLIRSHQQRAINLSQQIAEHPDSKKEK